MIEFLFALQSRTWIRVLKRQPSCATFFGNFFNCATQRNQVGPKCRLAYDGFNLDVRLSATLTLIASIIAMYQQDVRDSTGPIQYIAQSKYCPVGLMILLDILPQTYFAKGLNFEVANVPGILGFPTVVRRNRIVLSHLPSKRRRAVLRFAAYISRRERDSVKVGLEAERHCVHFEARCHSPPSRGCCCLHYHCVRRNKYSTSSSFWCC